MQSNLYKNTKHVLVSFHGYTEGIFPFQMICCDKLVYRSFLGVSSTQCTMFLEESFYLCNYLDYFNVFFSITFA